MFLHLSVILFTGGGCVAGGHLWQGMRAWRGGGACTAGETVKKSLPTRQRPESDNLLTHPEGK